MSRGIKLSLSHASRCEAVSGAISPDRLQLTMPAISCAVISWRGRRQVSGYLRRPPRDVIRPAG
jgi:hypothetical protein